MSHLSPGVRAHQRLGFSRLAAAPGKVLVPLGNHLHLHSSLPLLHPDLPPSVPHWALRWEVLRARHGDWPSSQLASQAKGQ